MKFTSIFLCLAIFVTSVNFAFAQTTTTQSFKVASMVSDGKKTKEMVGRTHHFFALESAT